MLYLVKFEATDSGRESEEAASVRLTSFLQPSDQY